MKVTIRGNNPVTGDNVKDIIDKLNEEYEPFGLKVKNMTCYIRFMNEEGEIVEPVNQYGDPMDRTITINKIKKVDDPKKDKGKAKGKGNAKDKGTDKSSIFDIGEE